MRSRLLTLAIALALPIGMATSVQADNVWQGGTGTPLNIWDDPNNWDSGIVPQSATERHIDPNAADDLNVARMKLDGTNTLVDSSVNATAFAVQVGHTVDVGVFPLDSQSASNTFTMTGGSVTQQGNFGTNIGRGRNYDPNHLVQFNMSGGLYNASIFTVPEAFGPSGPSIGLNAEAHFSGNSEMHTDLLRLGSQDANSLVTISGSAKVILDDNNNGFSPGVLWIEAFEDPNDTGGTSLLEITEWGQLYIKGEWWTDENGDGQRGKATASEYQYFLDEYVSRGWLTAGGGTLYSGFFDPDGNGDGTIIFSAHPIPEPATLGLLALACPWLLRRRFR